MCGIVAAICNNKDKDKNNNASNSNVVPILLEGLKKLEYRGYDSAGIAVIAEHNFSRIRSVGRVAELEKQCINSQLTSAIGIAHTRWATHGIPSENNAHPHISNNICVVHNGIIENYEQIRQKLQQHGYIFHSETDTECIAHLISFYAESKHCNLLNAVQSACLELVGAFAIAVINKNLPSEIIVARQNSPLILGCGNNNEGNFAASDASALLQKTNKMIYLENGDIARLTADNIEIFSSENLENITKLRPLKISELSPAAVELGKFRHFMQKEIFEQPDALVNTLEIISGCQTIQPQIFGANAENIFQNISKILILACGTSAHSGLVARYWLESIAKIPCQVEIASEYRYRHSIADENQLIVAISQSGETADTLAAIKHAKSLGQHKTLAICNVAESAIIRECELKFLTRAGPEIGVASTKAFTTQLVALFLLTLVLADIKHKKNVSTKLLNDLRHLPAAINKVLALEPQISEWAKQFANKHNALFLGRGLHYPIALEGALKLKEISYIHAEAYPAGELKHGPLALVDSNMPVIVVAPNDELLDKLKANLKEVEARGGELYVFADANADVAVSPNLHLIQLPEHYGELSPILHVIPLQLLAYHSAFAKGTDIDKPRNLAKSVTVE